MEADDVERCFDQVAVPETILFEHEAVEHPIEGVRDTVERIVNAKCLQENRLSLKTRVIASHVQRRGLAADVAEDGLVSRW